MIKRFHKCIKAFLLLFCLCLLTSSVETVCPYPRNVANAVFHPYKSQYQTNETAKYTCNAGMGTTDNTTTICLANTGWSLNWNLPSCFPICGPPDTVPNAIIAMIRGGPPHFIGDKVTYSCPAPFNISILDPVESVCQPDQTWNRSTVYGNLPKCHCQSYPTFLNGFAVPAFAQATEEITYKCTPGYKAVGTISTNRCEPSGLWKHPTVTSLVSCATTCSDTPAVFVGATAKSNTTPPFVAGDVYVYICNDPVFTINPDVTTCMANNKWSLDIYPLQCRQTRCFPPSSPRNGGYFPVKAAYDPGDEVKYFCNKGHQTTDLLVSICDRSRTWTLGGFPPRCLSVCDAPPIVPNTRVTGDVPPYFVDEIITYECVAGLRNSKYVTATSKCQSNHQWSFNAIQESFCNCPPAPTLGNGTISPEVLRAPGESITYACLPGFSLVGSSVNRCLVEGGWEFPNGPPGTRCVEDKPLWCLSCDWTSISSWYSPCYEVTHHSPTPEKECNYPPSANAYCLTRFVIVDDLLYSIERGCQAGLVLEKSPSDPTCVTTSLNEVSGVRTSSCYFACNHFHGCNDVTAATLTMCPVNCGIYGRCDYLSGKCICVRGFAGRSCSTKIELFSANGATVHKLSTRKAFLVVFISFTIWIANENIW